MPYLAFADDILIFARCSEDCLTALSSLFERYQAYSGQRINVGKSSFVLSNKASVDHAGLVSAKLHFRC